MRLIGILTLLASLTLLAPASTTRNAGAATPPPARISLRVGQVVRVVGTPVACKAITRAGARMLDCRLAGPLAGTYGTLMSGRRLLVVRFRNARLAKIVFEATQHGSYRTCR